MLSPVVQWTSTKERGFWCPFSFVSLILFLFCSARRITFFVLHFLFFGVPFLSVFVCSFGCVLMFCFLFVCLSVCWLVFLFVGCPQVKKALIASGVSLLFTLVVTLLAFTKMEDMKNGTANYTIPVCILRILCISCILRIFCISGVRVVCTKYITNVRLSVKKCVLRIRVVDMFNTIVVSTIYDEQNNTLKYWLISLFINQKLKIQPN